ncbi:aerotolerance protein BatA [Bacteroidia bacterium]|nr:aerotolerance protein BatA [Bacteroidia bacterium]
MFGYEFANPEYFLLLLLIPLMVTWYVFKDRDAHADLQFSSLRVFRGIRYQGKAWLRHALFVLKNLALVFLITALARPQLANSWQTSSTEGIEIMIALDISSSMLARDFKPDRLESAKSVVTKFILERPQDKIGLVIFSGESFTQCPLTTDQAVLVNLIRDVHSGMVQDGTAIGLGLANAVNRLKDSPGKSKVVILMTDGVNNQGSIAPVTAAELAKAFNIRVYTIGVGTNGEAPYPVQTPFGIQLQNMPVEIDEDVLKQISLITDGKYFRATNNNKLMQIYEEIDKLEKTKIEVKNFSKKNEHYFWFALVGALILVGEGVLRYTLLRKIP